MFGVFTQGNVLVDSIPPSGIPASLLLTNPTSLEVGAVILGLAALLVLGGITAISYKLFYKKGVEVIASKKNQ